MERRQKDQEKKLYHIEDLVMEFICLHNSVWAYFVREFSVNPDMKSQK